MSEFQQQTLCKLDTYEIKGKAGEMEKGKKTKQNKNLSCTLGFTSKSGHNLKGKQGPRVLASGTVRPSTMIADPGKTKGRAE